MELNNMERMKQLKERVALATRSSLSPVKLGEWESKIVAERYSFYDEEDEHVTGVGTIIHTYSIYQQMPQFRTILRKPRGYGDQSHPSREIESFHLPFPYIIYLVHKTKFTRNKRDGTILRAGGSRLTDYHQLATYMSHTPFKLSDLYKKLCPLWLPNINFQGEVCLGSARHGIKKAEDALSIFWNTMFDEIEEAHMRPNSIENLKDWEELSLEEIISIVKEYMELPEKGRVTCQMHFGCIKEINRETNE